MPLTDVKIRQAKPSEKTTRMTDGHGLYIEIKPSGSKLWRYRYKIAGKENLYAIGEYPSMSLQDARRARDDARELVKKGIHPSHVRRQEKAEMILSNTHTFESVAREWLGVKSKKCTKSYTDQITNCLERNAFPRLGKLPIREISSVMILAILKDMEKRNAQSFALLLKHWISSIFKYGIVTLRAESDPTFVLQGAIERPTVQHSTAMTESQIAEFKRRLENYKGHYTTICAIRLMLYTFVRTTEIRRAAWDEIDLDSKEWRIPSGRMKMKRIHIVPMSRQVIALLNDLSRINGEGKHLFPHMSRPNEVMSSNTINMALHYMGYGQYEWTGHDFRATASTRLHEMGFADHLIELQLAHVEGDRTRRAYNHARYLTERADMMQRWCDWVDGL